MQKILNSKIVLIQFQVKTIKLASIETFLTRIITMFKNLVCWIRLVAWWRCCCLCGKIIQDDSLLIRAQKHTELLTKILLAKLMLLLWISSISFEIAQQVYWHYISFHQSNIGKIINNFWFVIWLECVEMMRFNNSSLFIFFIIFEFVFQNFIH